MLYSLLKPLNSFDAKVKIYNTVCKTYRRRGIDNRDWNVWFNTRFNRFRK